MSQARKKRQWNFGIQFKLTLGLFVVFAMSAIGLNLIVSNQIRHNYEQQIQIDTADMQNNANVYARQLLILNNLNNEPDNFPTIAQDVLNELYSLNGNQMAVYQMDGTMLASTDEKPFDPQAHEDLDYAMQGQVAVTFLPKHNGGLWVRMAFPLNVEGRDLGILRMVCDYSSLRQQGARISSLVMMTTVGIFLLALVLVQWMVRSFTKPTLQLARLSTRVAREMGAENVSEVTLPPANMLARTDEIGTLANNYAKMIRKINQQFDRIRKDRNSIREMYEYKQEFYNNVTHELKTPLTSIQGYAQIVQDNGFSDPAFFQKGMQHIVDESHRLHTMVIQLLEMSDRSLAQPFEPVALSRMLREGTEAMNFKAQRYHNRFVMEIEPDLWVDGQEDRLKELWINLLDNAIKYGEAGRPIQTRAWAENDCVRFCVTNAGPGLTQEQMEQIFTPFYRVDKQRSREKGSAGLGLSICQKIVEEHQGHIEVQSEPGQWTTFIVTLPKGMEADEE